MFGSVRQLLGRFLAPALLLFGAGIHAYLVRTQNLTPWEGGGFGMFSTIDHQHARFVRSYLITPQGDVPVRTPPRGHRLPAAVLWKIASPDSCPATSITLPAVQLPLCHGSLAQVRPSLKYGRLLYLLTLGVAILYRLDPLTQLYSWFVAT